MKKILLLSVFLASCASMEPRIGMSFQEWNDQCRAYQWVNGKLVAADSETQVYTCQDQNQVYIFQNEQLVMIDRVQAPSNPNQAQGIYNALLGISLLNQSN